MDFGKIKSTRYRMALDGQTIDGGVGTNDCVYNNAGTWSKAGSSNKPYGVYEGSNIVVLRGLIVLSGLTANSNYYMDSSGELTTTATPTFIGVSLSTTELMIDIQER